MVDIATYSKRSDDWETREYQTPALLHFWIDCWNGKLGASIAILTFKTKARRKKKRQSEEFSL